MLMGDGEHLDDVRADLIDDIVWEPRDEDAPHLGVPWRTNRWMSENQISRSSHRYEKAVPESGNRCVVVGRRGDEFIARLGMELQCHCFSASQLPRRRQGRWSDQQSGR